MRNFIAFSQPDGSDVNFINLDLVRHVDQVRPGHIRLSFDREHAIEFNGPIAALILARVGNRAIAADGIEIGVPNAQNSCTPIPDPPPATVETAQPASPVN
jgi:hypothetical protein